MNQNQNKERKVCFAVTQEQYEQVKMLPRSFNLSEELRGALTNILKSKNTIE